MKLSVHAIPLQSRPLRGAPASPRGKPRGRVRIRLGAFQLVFCVPQTPPPRLRAALLPFQGRSARKNCGDSQGIAAAGFLRGCGQTSPRGRGGEWLHLSRSPGSCITERRAAFSDRSNGRGHAPWRAASALTVAVPPRIHTGFPILRPIPGGT